MPKRAQLAKYLDRTVDILHHGMLSNFQAELDAAQTVLREGFGDERDEVFAHELSGRHIHPQRQVQVGNARTQVAI